MSESSMEKRAMELALRIAKKIFAGHPEFDDRVNDAVSVAWEMTQGAPPAATARSIAEYAIDRVKSGGVFGRRTQSIENPAKMRSGIPKPRRVDIHDLDEFASQEPDPAKIVAFRLDTRLWWQTLTAKQRLVAGILAIGWSGKDAARMVGLSQGRISQIRDEAHQKWELLQV